MKTRGLFLSTLLIGAAMTGCSNEDVMNLDNEKSLQNSDNFVAVDIVSPTDVVSRGSEGEYEAGSELENAVSNAMFVFYNANGAPVDAVATTTMTWNEGTGSVDKISSALVVLSDPQTLPTQVVALLNTDLTEIQLESMTLSELQALKGDFSSEENFVMSNSVYKNGENIVTATPLTDANICSSETAALANPVSIPVERVLAKVEVSKSASFAVLDPDVATKLDGESVKFIPTITGMALVETNPESYLLKDINNVTGWIGWNDATKFRSYWANSAVPDQGYKSLSWDAISGKNYDSFSGYCHENTSETSTKLLVTAQFKAEGAEAPVTVIKYNGTYFTVDGLKNYFSEHYFKTLTHGEENSNEWRNHMTFVSANTENEWEVKLALVADGETQVPTVNGEVNIEDVLASINSKTMSQWTDGKCYYYVNVEHFGGEGYEVGVVRNHLYDITINSIKGLGTPVFDPTQEINPGTPEEEHYYVAAEVKILKWKIVSQSVALE